MIMRQNGFPAPSGAGFILVVCNSHIFGVVPLPMCRRSPVSG
jgi:hypothetical protein